MAEETTRVATSAYRQETTWLREFTRFHGTEGITRFAIEDLNGVTLVRVLEALKDGDCVVCEKCEGPGTKCVVEHKSDEPPNVRVVVHFVANEGALTICKADSIGETESEPDRAA